MGLPLPFRVFRVVLASLFRPRIQDLSAGVVESFRVTPFDLDVFKHMNNARYLSYMEVARWSFQIQTGFLQLAIKKGWISPLSRIDIRYNRPLKLFQKFTVSVSLIRIDEKFVYLYQEFRSDGKVVAQALVASALREKRKIVPVEQYLTPLGYRRERVYTPPKLHTWLNEFAASDKDNSLQ